MKKVALIGMDPVSTLLALADFGDKLRERKIVPPPAPEPTPEEVESMRLAEVKRNRKRSRRLKQA